jgi:hypothetical protein
MLKSRIWLVLALFAGLGGVGAVLLARSGEPAKMHILARPAELVSGWPADRYWSWSFPRPSPAQGELIDLQIRQKSTLLAKGEIPRIPFSPKAMTAAEAEHVRHAGMIGPLTQGKQESPGQASIQLLDLSEIGAVSTKPGQDLRVLAKLSVGGTMARLDEIELPAGRFAGSYQKDEGAWVNGEIHLTSFWVRTEEGVIQFDVVLKQLSAPAVQQ